MVDAVNMNEGIARAWGNSNVHSPRVIYVPGYGRINAETGVFRPGTSEKETEAAQKKSTVDEETSAELKKLKEACQNFESIFLYQLFQIMRQSGPKSDLLDSGFASDVYQDMFDEQLATEMSRSGSFGLADVIYEQLKSAVTDNSTNGNNTVKAG